MKVIAKFSFSRRALGLSLSVAVSMALLFVLFATEDAERAHAQTGTSTPSPTSTLSPSPEPTDSCLTSLSSDGTVDGNWNDDCESEGRSDSYASYYSFTLTESAEVTITTESSVDTYLFLRQGSGRSGSELCNNDDYGSEVSGNLCQSIESTLESEYDSGLVASLDAGSYIIEVTTYDEGETGEFTLTISGMPADVAPTPTPEPTTTPTPEPSPTLLLSLRTSA